jgi:uncharacterized protein YciI
VGGSFVVEIKAHLVVEADYVDGAAERREPHRQEHLERVLKLGGDGSLVLAGGYEDMKSSLLVFTLTDEQAVADIIESDVYWREGIWTDYRIRKLNAVPVT